MPTIVGLVSAGLGCAVVPSSYRHQGPANVVIQDLPGLDLKVELELVWRTDQRDPLLTRFVQAFQDASEAPGDA